MTLLQRLARRLGYDLTLRKKARPHEAQLTAVLERFEISCVLDVGANVGQYALMLREGGFGGKIVSFEPLADAHATLVRRAAADAGWQIAPRMAIGDRDGEALLEVSAEPDMSSILPQSELLREISPSSAVLRRERVPMARLESAAQPYLAPEDRIFLKIDTQGFEPQVLAGAGRPDGAALRPSAGDVAGALLRGRGRLSRDARQAGRRRLRALSVHSRLFRAQARPSAAARWRFHARAAGSRRTHRFDARAGRPYINVPDPRRARNSIVLLPPYITEALAPVHRDGWPFIAGGAGGRRSCSACCGRRCSGSACWSPPGWPTSFATRARVTPQGDGIVVSPADGVVQAIAPRRPPPELQLGDAPLHLHQRVPERPRRACEPGAGRRADHQARPTIRASS